MLPHPLHQRTTRSTRLQSIYLSFSFPSFILPSFTPSAFTLLPCSSLYYELARRRAPPRVQNKLLGCCRHRLEPKPSKILKYYGHGRKPKPNKLFKGCRHKLEHMSNKFLKCRRNRSKLKPGKLLKSYRRFCLQRWHHILSAPYLFSFYSTSSLVSSR